MSFEFWSLTTWLRPHFCFFPVVRAQGSYLISLSLGFLICKNEIIISKCREQGLICHKQSKPMEPDIDNCLRLYTPEADSREEFGCKEFIREVSKENMVGNTGRGVEKCDKDGKENNKWVH